METASFSIFDFCILIVLTMMPLGNGPMITRFKDIVGDHLEQHASLQRNFISNRVSN